MPLTDPKSGKVQAILAVDFDARHWKMDLAVKAGLPVGMAVLALVAIILIGTALSLRRGRREGLPPGWLRHLEPGLTVAVGLVLTLFAAWLAHNEANRNQAAAFRHLAESRTAALAEAFHGLRDVELEGLARFGKVSYDVAVLDYHLPDGKGDTILGDFRAQNPGCVCVMMTSDPNPVLALAWMKAGAATYLRKPFDPEYLIEECVRARRERDLLRVEDLLEERTRELRDREAMLGRKTTMQRMLLDTIDIQVWYLTDIETYGQLNRAHADFLGLDVKAAAHKRLAEFLSEEVATVCRASNNEVFRTKQPMRTQEWIPDAEGELRLIAITKTPRLDAHGNVEYVVCAGASFIAP